MRSSSQEAQTPAQGDVCQWQTASEGQLAWPGTIDSIDCTHGIIISNTYHHIKHHIKHPIKTYLSPYKIPEISSNHHCLSTFWSKFRSQTWDFPPQGNMPGYLTSHSGSVWTCWARLSTSTWHFMTVGWLFRCKITVISLCIDCFEKRRFWYICFRRRRPPHQATFCGHIAGRSVMRSSNCSTPGASSG